MILNFKPEFPIADLFSIVVQLRFFDNFSEVSCLLDILLALKSND
jgi:hypothetical protein